MKLAGRMPPWPAALFVVLAGCVLALGIERSGWILITQPLEASHATNSLLGYSLIREASILHAENQSSFHQLAFFAGADVPPDLYFRRPVYTFVAALLAPWIGPGASLLAVNLCAWVLALWLCHRFTRRFYGDAEAARWAGLLAAGGIGFVLHALDLSAHLLSFVFYMGGAVLIYESEVWRRAVAWRVHAAIAAYLALACLQYNTGVALVAAYVLVAFRHNALLLVAGAGIAPLLAQPAWDSIVGALYAQRHGVALPGLAQAELDYLRRSLEGWMSILRSPPADAARSAAALVASFGFFELPLVVVLGGARLLADWRAGGEARNRARFAAPFIAMPVAAALVFAPAALARGYLVYGISLFFFAGCGAAIARSLHGRRFARNAAGCALIALCVAWSTAHFLNVLGPAKAYFLGMEYAAHLFTPGGWQAASLTGLEPTPRLFGGAATLAEAGLQASTAAPLPPAGNVKYALAASAPIVALAAALAGLCFGGSAAAIVAAALLSSSVAGALLFPGSPGATPIHRTYAIEAGRTLVYRVALSDETRSRLASGLDEGRAPVLFAGFYDRRDAPVVRIGGRDVRAVRKLNRTNWLLDPGDLLGALRSGSRELEIAWPGGPDHWVGGWQRTSLASRRIVVEGGGPEPAVLPAVEIRLLRDAASVAPVYVGF